MVTPEAADKIMYAFSLRSTPAPGYEDPDAWKADLFSRGSRAADETLTMIHDSKYGMMKFVSFIPGLERGDIAWKRRFDGVDPAQLIENRSRSLGITR